MSDAAARYPHVERPLQLGPVRLRNRILVSPHALLYGKDSRLSERHFAYYAERARGGVALQITEGHCAHPLAKGIFSQGVTAWAPTAVEDYRRLADAVHAHGGAQFVQLFQPGVRDRGTELIDHFHPLWGPSAIPSVMDGEMPLAMEQEHIDDLVRHYAQSAANVRDGGLDGVEIHGAFSSSLVGQFMSPAFNRRSDAYGGTPERRCRLAIEIAAAIRERVGSDIAVGMRFSIDELMGPGGTTVEVGARQLEVLAATGLLDFFDVSGSSYNSLHMGVASMSVPEGYLVELGRRAKEVVGDRAAVFVVGRIRDLALAERVLADTGVDMVAMTRAHIADPFLVEKSLAGREREVQRCVAVNVCLARNFDSREVYCMMNPATGREARWGHGTLAPAATPRDVLVVGGGVGGMRAAATAAARGHRVRLLERAGELGGHLNVLKALPRREGWQVAIDNLVNAMDVAGVAVELGVEATPELVAAAAPDVVVCATGSSFACDGFTPSRPERDRIPGVEHDFVVPVDVAAATALRGPWALGRHVLIVDETGTYLPLGLAELLGAAGVAVEVVTRLGALGEEVVKTHEAPHLFPRLVEHGVRLSPGTQVERIGRDGSVELQPAWGGAPRTVADVTTVVLAMLRRPENALQRALAAQAAAAGAGPELHAIGDALTPRTPALAIYEGEQLARAL